MAESMKGLKRTHRCTELSSANVGEVVTVSYLRGGSSVTTRLTLGSQ